MSYFELSVVKNGKPVTITLLLVYFLFLNIPLSMAQMTETARDTVTLADAITIALDNNFQLKQAQNNEKLAQAGVLSAKADFLPTLNANMSATRRVGQQFDQATVSFEDKATSSIGGNLGGNITLFNGFQQIQNLRQSQSDYEAQKETTERLRESVIFNTAGRFLQVILNRELLIIAQENLEASQSRLEQIRAQVEVGTSPAVDQFNQESAVAQDELAVIQRENALRNSEMALYRIMQTDSEAQFVFLAPDLSQESEFLIDLGLEEMIDMAMSLRSDLKAQEYRIESAKSGVVIARSAMIPSISASAGINASYNDQFTDPITREKLGFTDQFFDRNVNRSLGISLNLPIFNNWNRRVSLESAKVNLRNSELNLEDIRFQILEEVRQAYSDYQAVLKELETAEKALIAAERAFETEQQRYTIGATTLIELNQANANFVQARSGQIQTLYNAYFQNQLLDFYIGRLTPKLNSNEN
ncbi:MAG: TolC family protein [Bacteroidetes bacterium]|nr:MAG: TolC family protein [Bacteroidota bacterium]